MGDKDKDKEYSISGSAGHLHPINRMIRRINEIFSDLGFSLVEGPELENEYYNFDALNIPEFHPARDLWDTVWVKPEKDRKQLRPHTSPVQIRYMENNKPPFRIIVPGKVFRQEATDATHETQFYQLEGLMVDKDVSLAHLKGVFKYFFDNFFGVEVNIRLRPSYFPFVEPGVELDLSCFNCKGEGCSVCKYTGWIELVGAGMVHPKVLEHGGVNPRHWQGFAFGMGLDRLVMLTYGIDDIRLFYSGDLRLIDQF